MKKVLYIVEDTKTAQFRYRVKNALEALERSSEWKGEWILTEDISGNKLADVDLVVILRQTAKDKKILDFVRLAQERKIKVLFDLDDLIFDYKDLPALMKGTNSKNIIYWFGYFFGIRKIAKRVDGFIATNNFLGKKIKKSFSKPCAIIPNSLNNVQLEVAEKCLGKKKKNNSFVIGYFSGSPTHSKDLEMVESALLEFLDAHKDAKFRMVGYMKLSDKMLEKIDKKQVEIFKLANYLKQLEMMSEVDVNIAPLVINEFTNCKSELKFFEAAAVETTTIASPSYTFKKAIKDGENGFLAYPGEWYDKLEYLYEHPNENRRIAKNAREYALANYRGEKLLREIEEAYEFFE